MGDGLSMLIIFSTELNKAFIAQVRNMNCKEILQQMAVDGGCIVTKLNLTIYNQIVLCIFLSL
jgi:hypothetical protein